MAVLQVKTATSGPAVQTISSTTPVAITGLSIDFTPISATSLIVVRATLVSSATHVTSFGVFKDGAATVDTTGQTNTNEPNMQNTTYIGSTTTAELWSFPLIWAETSGSTTQRTYQIYGTAGWSGTTYNLYINDRGNNDMATFSYMTVMEVEQ